MIKNYDNLICYPEITEFLRSELCPIPREIIDFEKELRDEGDLPIVKPETARLLMLLLTLKKPKKILEIGTAVGFSALLMSKTCPDAEIKTIDRFEYMINRAKENFKKYDTHKKITLLEGQARDYLKSLDEKFDFILLDAAKGQYPSFLPDCLRLLSDDGLFFADNVLFDGLVAEDSRSTRRDKTIIRRLRTFLNMLATNEELTTSIISIGDGVALATRK